MKNKVIFLLISFFVLLPFVSAKDLEVNHTYDMNKVGEFLNGDYCVYVSGVPTSCVKKIDVLEEVKDKVAKKYKNFIIRTFGEQIEVDVFDDDFSGKLRLDSTSKKVNGAYPVPYVGFDFKRYDSTYIVVYDPKDIDYDSFFEKLEVSDQYSAYNFGYASSFYPGKKDLFQIGGYENVIYYSSFRIGFDSDNSDFDIEVNYHEKTYKLSEKPNAFFYYNLKEDKVDSFKTETTITDLVTDDISDLKKITSVTTHTKITPYDSSEYNYYYYFKPDGSTEEESWQKITYKDKYFEYIAKENGTLFIKINSLDDSKTLYTSTFKVDQIGQQYDESIITKDDNPSDDIGDIGWDNVKDIITSPIDFAKGLISSIGKYFTKVIDSKLKIINQIQEIISSFGSFGYYPDCWCHGGKCYSGKYVCFPDWEIDFTNVGFDVQVRFDFDWFMDYRDTIFMYIKIILGFATFFKVFRMISRAKE